MNTMTNRRSQKGFTLIELMIVVAVMGILLAVAIPAYNEQVRSTRRADMKADVMQIVQALERFHTVNDTYDGFPTAVVNSPTGGTTAYTITPSNLARTTYTVTAVPQNAQATDRCGTIAINQAGVVTISTGLDREICW